MDHRSSEVAAAPAIDAPRDNTTGDAWSPDDIAELAQAEPAQVLAESEALARHAVAKAEAIAGGLRARAAQELAEVNRLRTEASHLLSEASELRSGKLLPLPRPEWAGSGDDAVALGAALDWQAEGSDSHERALIESAMAAAGLLGARIDEAGVSTDRWRVSAAGGICPRNLSAVIGVDDAHPLASTATAVLARVRLESTAVPCTGSDLADDALCIGRDGTFRAGVLVGRSPEANDQVTPAPATHIGARQRRAAALARAEILEMEAAQLEERAVGHERVAIELKADAEVVSAQGQTTPSREDLRTKEAQRAEAARLAELSRQLAAAAEAERAQALRELNEARKEWIDRTIALGLPADKRQLLELRDRGKSIAVTLREAARPLAEKLAQRLDVLLAAHRVDDTDQRLLKAEADAQDAYARSRSTEAAIRTLEETAGSAIAEILAKHEQAKERHSTLIGERPAASQAEIDKAKAQSSAEEKLSQARQRLQNELQPNALHETTALSSLMSVPGVAQAVLGEESLASGTALIEQLESKLRGKRTLTVKTVLERADAARAKLAGIWSVDPGENHGELLTYSLTYRDVTYPPVEAAAHARKLKTRAEQALAASEERALRDFVIGRLPNAIAKAWTHLQDWIVEVNRKMRSAAASSGVGVQVRMPIKDDLPPASREVYELSCRTSNAERSPAQQQQLGEALRSLIDAASGETMQERLASAIDIRDWVEVYYEVTRPGGKMQRWSTRTGLSGGERRLVVLAPMLAAIAANYDRYGERALRLVALDEIPAEVDERGREGLARYIAELDLDLICTSYLWDGCPGAWDGIDAFDLEAGTDGTVVAFPMLVRGLDPIPETGAGSAPNAQGDEK